MRLIYSFVFFFLISTVLQGQKPMWKQFDGPAKQGIERLYKGENGDIYAYNGGDIFESKDGSKTWSRLDLPLLTYSSSGLCTNGYWHFAQYSSFQIMRTNSDMQEWEYVAPKFTNTDERLRHFTFVGSILIAQSSMGIYRSSDYGSSWQKQLSFPETQVSRSGSATIASTNSMILASSDEDVYRSTDTGITWEKVWIAPDDIEAFYCSDTLQFALLRNDDLVFASKDGFKTQTQTDADAHSKYSTRFLFTKDTAFLIRPRSSYDTIPYLYFSVDEGVHWSQKDIDDGSFLLRFPTSIKHFDNQIFITNTDGIDLYEHANFFKKIKTLEGLGEEAVDKIETTDDYIWVMQNREVYRKLKSGNTWEKVEFEVLEGNERVYDFVKVREFLVFKVGEYLLWTEDEGEHIHKLESPHQNSSSFGGTWWFTKESVWNYHTDGLYRQSKNFQQWEEVEIDEPFMDSEYLSFANIHGVIIAYTNNGNFYSIDDADTWQEMPEMDCFLFSFEPDAGPYVAARYDNQVIWWCNSVTGAPFYRTEIPDFGLWDYRMQDYDKGVIFGSKAGDDVLLNSSENMLWLYRYEDNHFYFSNNPYGHYYRLENEFPARTVSAIHESGGEFYVGSQFRGIYQYGPLDIQKKDEKKLEVSLYPNPTSGMLHLQSDALVGAGLYDIHIYNSFGRLMYSNKRTPASILEFDVSLWSSGLYFLKVDSEHGNYEARFVKQ